MWKSKSQQGVSLSSSEAEYYAMAEAVKDVKFVVHILNVLALRLKCQLRSRLIMLEQNSWKI
jgi:hypothetical protein